MEDQDEDEVCQLEVMSLGTGDKKHKKKRVSLKVFYVNARSINGSRANENKVRYVRQHIEAARPDFVAIVETWLTGSKRDEDILASLGLDGFTLYRKDRVDTTYSGRVRRGGGMILAIKSTIVAELVDGYKDQFIWANFMHTFNCVQCAGANEKSYSMGLLYRRKQPYRSDQTRAEFDEESRQLWDDHVSRFLAPDPSTSGAVLLGDFNFDIKVEIPDLKDLPWGTPRSAASRIFLDQPIYKGFKKVLPSSYERGLFESIEEAGLEQLVEDATHKDGNILDLIFSSPGFVKTIKNGGNIGVNSITQDHCILTFKLFLGYDCDRE